MTNTKKVKRIAKDLFAQSLTDGFIDEVKIGKNLKLLISAKPAHLVQILKIFKRLIRAKLEKEEILVETADKKAVESLESFFLKKTRARKIKYKQNPKIVFGARITHGDWIWDATLAAKLKSLTQID